MSPLRTFTSFAAVLAAVAALAGCYDLSAPSGPHQDDFIRNRAGSAPNDEPVPSGTCAQEPCVTTSIRDTVQPAPTPIRRAAVDLDDAARAPDGERLP